MPLSLQFKHSQGRPPGLAVIRVGHDPASLIYIQHKRRRASTLKIHFEEHHIPRLTDPSHLLRLIRKLNQSSHIDGLILQLPLPVDNTDAFLESQDPLESIAPEKDVDGLHPFNRGLLYSQSEPSFVPCTPLGCLYLLKHYDLSVAGREAVIMGRSVLVGRPLAALLLRENATVTIVHSQTPHLKSITRRADFLFVAIGRAGFVNGSFFKKGAVVVDIGIHSKRGRVHGDVCPASLTSSSLRAFSPVPGGVGPLTVMGLMHNTLKAAYRQCALPFPLSL